MPNGPWYYRPRLSEPDRARDLRKEDGHERIIEPLAEVEAAAGNHPRTWIALELRYARAILATDPEIAAARFEDALTA